MKKNLKVICVIFSLAASFSVFAQPKSVKEVVDEKYCEELLTKGLVSIIHNDDAEGYKLLPTCELTNQVREFEVENEKGNFPFSLEYIFLLHKKDLITNPNKTDITIDDIANIMRSSSKMNTVTYYSNTRKKYMPLYKGVYRVDNPENRNRIDDIEEFKGNEVTFYAFQDDQSFGETVYEQKIFRKGNSIYTHLDNLDTMGLGPFKAIKPHALSASILCIDCCEDVVLYMCMDADCKKYPGIGGTMYDSLDARIHAIKNWIVVQF